MTPYYDDGSCVIYHGDCRELFPVWDWSGAFMVTDPPYGMGYVSSQGVCATAPIVGDADTSLRDAVLSMWGSRPALVFGTWRAPRPKATRELIIWNKTDVGFSGNLTIPWGPCHEEIYVLGAGFVGKRRPNVYSVAGLASASSERPDHPTPKPVSLMRDLVGYCAPLAEVVDPFMGSGTTLRAAKDLGRRAIGIEIEERYCEIAAKRLAQEVFDFGSVGDTQP